MDCSLAAASADAPGRACASDNTSNCIITCAENKDGPTCTLTARRVSGERRSGATTSVMNVWVPAGHIPDVTAAAVQTEQCPTLTASRVHDGSTATAKFRVQFPFKADAVLWPRATTVHTSGLKSEAPSVIDRQTARGSDSALPTDTDISNTCIMQSYGEHVGARATEYATIGYDATGPATA